MANTFGNATAESISNSSTIPTTVLTTPSGNATVRVIVGMQITNTSASEIKMSALISSNLTTTYHTVTTADSSGNPAFKINGSFTPSITLKKNHTYVFDVSDSSNSTHAFKFTSATPTGTVTDISSGYTASGTAGTKGATVTWVVPSGTTNAWYYCSAHTYNNKMNVTPTAFTIAADTSEDMILFKDIAVPSGGMVSVLTGDKLILKESDSIKVYSDTASAGNVVVSYLNSDNT